MFYLIGFGVGLVLSLVLVASTNEHLEVSFTQLKKSCSKVFNVFK